jgi:hypothetical protein
METKFYINFSIYHMLTKGLRIPLRYILMQDIGCPRRELMVEHNREIANEILGKSNRIGG